MKKVLILDRYYTTRFAKSEKYEFVVVALTKKNKQNLIAEGYNVVACFEEEYDLLTISDYPNNYLIHSFDSDRFLKRYSLQIRREILGKEITFWAEILDSHKPDFIINEVCTIEWMEVLYIEALKRNIKYNTFLFGQIPHMTYWLETPFNSAITPSRLDTIKPSVEHYEKAREFVKAIKEKPNKPFYSLVKKHNVFKVFLSSVKHYMRDLYRESKHEGFLYEYYSEQRKPGIESSWKMLYKKHDKFEINEKYEYVFYPLHYEPEATLSYFSEFYANQVDVIRAIAHSLKTNQILIVKEHPQQVGMLLTKKYQNLKKDFPNLMFLNGNVPSFDILKSIKLLVTLTGTGGFEAMITGIPVIVLGDVFYNCCRSVNRCQSFNELKDYIRNDSYIIPNEKDNLDFVAKFISLQTKFFPYFIKDTYEKSDIKNMRLYIESM